MKKLYFEFKWSIIFTVTIISWMFLEEIFGFYRESISYQIIVNKFIGIPALVVFVYALLEIKKNKFQNHTKYTDVFISGGILSFFCTVLSPVSRIIFAKVIAPEYFTNMIDYKVSSHKMSYLEALDKYNLNNFLLRGLIITPCVCMVLVIVISCFLFTKSKKLSV